ncbi:uncharacterized protein TRIVIDRAFT_215417 [Trichoderma virens Gv29-8]|uniref:Uncharacterized protein n=1 Tax=Hypocrea virens (strain Gv29-8 / FGSC 10586) TaxID=413071 RepID=G9MIR1_HYPVG|nr:uncharacterized protein TRIVIDRAFT_215417 [Trichoderma virens Gv29-8]EHK25378.1 hypothetical protein TRIVIDRAFT_215417 [Trichoderma virens Gv29-8]
MNAKNKQKAYKIPFMEQIHWRKSQRKCRLFFLFLFSRRLQLFISARSEGLWDPGSKFFVPQFFILIFIPWDSQITRTKLGVGLLNSVIMDTWGSRAAVGFDGIVAWHRFGRVILWGVGQTRKGGKALQRD